MVQSIQHNIRRIFRITAVGSSFFFFFIGGLLLSWVVLPLLFVFSKRDHRLCQKVVQYAFRLFHAYMRWFGLINYRPQTSPDLPIDGPCVIIANHPTLVDVTAIMARYNDIHCFVKASLFKNPVTGPLLRCCGHISAADGTQAIAKALRFLDNGARILIFPEGTRSPQGAIGHFDPMAFRLAARAGVPLCTLHVTVTTPALSKNVPWFKFPDKPVFMRIHPMLCFSVCKQTSSRIPASQLAQNIQDCYDRWNVSSRNL